MEHFVKSLGLANTFNTIHLSVSWELYSDSVEKLPVF